MQEKSYRNILGKLLYLANRTSPDLEFAVSLRAKFQNDTAPLHWNALTHVVSYLKMTTHYSLIFPSGGSMVGLEVHFEAEWGRDLYKRRFQTGYVMNFKSAAVLQKSKIQSATAVSTYEAQFAALFDFFKDERWMRQLLKDVFISPNGPTCI